MKTADWSIPLIECKHTVMTTESGALGCWTARAKGVFETACVTRVFDGKDM